METNEIDKSEKVFIKKNILCYGDSNTWGYIPGRDKSRYSWDIRWPGVLSKLLGTKYRVIEEGLPGRTTVHDDPIDNDENKNGLLGLRMAIASHAPLNLVIINLGTNDLKTRFSLSAFDIAEGIARLVKVVRSSSYGPDFNQAPEVLVVCPPPIWEVGNYSGPMFKGGREKSQLLRDEFSRMANDNNVPVIFSEDFLRVDPEDGIHYNADGHTACAQEFAKWIIAHYGNE